MGKLNIDYFQKMIDDFIINKNGFGENN